jgi:hypothetical protein
MARMSAALLTRFDATAEEEEEAEKGKAWKMVDASFTALNSVQKEKKKKNKKRE